jgi:hypothetical protein
MPMPAIINEINEMKRLLLMAAAVHQLGPGTRLNTANCAKVVWQALSWAGLVNDEVRTAWNELEYHPAILECYRTLIGMIRHAPAAEALFEGNGNFGSVECPRAFPLFTACRLTPLGESIAEQLLSQRPEYRIGGDGTGACRASDES